VPVAPEAKLAVKVTRLGLVAELGGGVADGRAQWQGARADDRRQGGPADRLDGAADELGQVDQVAADVRQRPRPRAALVAPAHRRARVDPVVAPVVAVEVQGPADGPGGDLVADGGDGRGAAEHEPDAGLPSRGLGRRHHGLGVLCGRGHRLLAQDMLAGGQQALHDLAVQEVGHDHADHVDVRRLGQGPPVVLGPLVPVAPGRIRGERLVDVGDRDQPDLGQALVVERGRRPVPGGMRPAGHAGPDHGHPDGRTCHCNLLPAGLPANRALAHLLLKRLI
jgi:hypothetical protein